MNRNSLIKEAFNNYLERCGLSVASIKTYRNALNRLDRRVSELRFGESLYDLSQDELKFVCSLLSSDDNFISTNLSNDRVLNSALKHYMDFVNRLYCEM